MLNVTPKKYVKYKSPLNPQFREEITAATIKEYSLFWNNNKVLRYKMGYSIDLFVEKIYMLYGFKTSRYTIIRAERGELPTLSPLYFQSIAKFWGKTFNEMYLIDLSRSSEYMDVKPVKLGRPLGRKNKPKLVA